MKTDPKKYGLRRFFYGILSLSILAHFAHHLITGLPVPMLPFIRDDFALDYIKSGLVIGAFTLSYGISQLPAGWLADRLGSRLLISIGISGVALACLLVGISPNYIMLIIFLALMGVMGGGYHPAAPPIISASVEANKQGRALGLHTLGGSASYSLAPLIAAAIATIWGWRGSFIILAIPVIAFGFTFFVLLGRRLAANKSDQVIVVSHNMPSLPRIPRSLRSLALFITLNTFVQAMFFSTLSFIPLYLVDHFGISQEKAAAFIALVFSSGLWAGPLGGYLSDRFGRWQLLLWHASLLDRPFTC
ncbi:MFS transporter [Chloroflexota bacterium]